MGKEYSQEQYYNLYRTRYDNPDLEKGDIEITKKARFFVKNKYADINEARKEGYDKITELVDYRLFYNLGGNKKGIFFDLGEMFGEDSFSFDPASGRIYMSPNIITNKEYKDAKYLLARLDYNGDIKKNTIVYPINNLDAIAEKILSKEELKSTQPDVHKSDSNVDYGVTLDEYKEQLERNRASLIAMKLYCHRVNIIHQIYALAFDKHHNVDIIKLDIMPTSKSNGFRGISRNTRPDKPLESKGDDEFYSIDTKDTKDEDDYMK